MTPLYKTVTLIMHTIKDIKNVDKLYKEHHGEEDTREHITARAGFSLLQNYFPMANNFTITPKQIQFVTGKRPDAIIQKCEATGTKFKFFSQVVVEFKRVSFTGS